MKTITHPATGLYERPNWIVFEQVPRHDGKKPHKVPYIPGTQRKAMPNDPGTWRTYAEAVADADRSGRLPACAITPDMNLTLIDIDGRTDHPLVETLDTYTERSVNGGLHILAAGRPLPGFVAPNGVEVYTRNGNRFVILTGDVLDGRDTIMDRSDRLALVFPARPAAARVAVSRDTALTLDDDAVLRGARDARNGAKFDRLWSGDTSGYLSASEADLALCSMLAFYTQDPVQIERLWLGSGLNPTARHGGNYRQRTIAKALDGNGVYTGTADPCAPIRDDFADFRAENARLRRMVAERDERIAALEARVMMFEKVQLRSAKILGNAALGPARVVAAALVQKIAWRVTATETPHAERGIPVPPGMMAMSVKEIAEAAGVNEGTAGKHLQLLADRGLIQRHIKSVYRTVDERTGEILDEPQSMSQHFFGPAEATALTADAPIALADAFASFTMERVENRGGKRIRRCPEHPTAEVVRIVVDRCAECRRELSPPVETVLPPMLLDPPDADPQDRSANFADHVLDHTRCG